MTPVALSEVYPERVSPSVSVMADSILAQVSLASRWVGKRTFDRSGSGISYHAFSPWNEQDNRDQFQLILSFMQDRGIHYDLLALDACTLSLHMSFSDWRKAIEIGALPSQVIRFPGSDGKIYYLEEFFSEGYRLSAEQIIYGVISERFSGDPSIRPMGLWYAAAEGVVRNLF